MGRAKTGLIFSGQNWPGFFGQKLARFFRAKILTAQPVLKIGSIGPNSLLKAKKIRAGWTGSGHTGLGHTRLGHTGLGHTGLGHTGLGHTGPGQIWPGFIRVNNLMAQLDPNFERTKLAHWVGPILPPLAIGYIIDIFIKSQWVTEKSYLEEGYSVP